MITKPFARDCCFFVARFSILIHICSVLFFVHFCLPNALCATHTQTHTIWNGESWTLNYYDFEKFLAFSFLFLFPHCPRVRIRTSVPFYGLFLYFDCTPNTNPTSIIRYPIASIHVWATCKCVIDCTDVQRCRWKSFSRCQLFLHT